MKQEKIHWFLVKKNEIFVEKNVLQITLDSLLHQFNRVLKFKIGERVVLFDGEGSWYKCEIKKLEKRECLLEILEKGFKKKEEDKIINLYFGIPKKNKFELILEKGTEVGVTSFHPIITERTEKLNINKERAEKILIEASEQSQTPLLPPLGKTQKIEAVIQTLKTQNTFVFHPQGKELVEDDFKFSKEINLLIGPEGGWSPNEIENFQKNNFKIYKAGDTILKTETACIVIPFLFNVNLPPVIPQIRSQD